MGQTSVFGLRSSAVVLETIDEQLLRCGVSRRAFLQLSLARARNRLLSSLLSTISLSSGNGSVRRDSWHSDAGSAIATLFFDAEPQPGVLLQRCAGHEVALVERNQKAFPGRGAQPPKIDGAQVGLVTNCARRCRWTLALALLPGVLFFTLTLSRRARPRQPLCSEATSSQ